MKLGIDGLTREQELTWLMALPWTFTSEASGDPGEFVVRVEEMRDAITIGTEDEVSREIWDSLRASLECRLDHGDAIPLPRALILPPPTVVHLASWPNKPNDYPPLSTTATT
jgi:hypothetical protein